MKLPVEIEVKNIGSEETQKENDILPSFFISADIVVVPWENIFLFYYWNNGSFHLSGSMPKPDTEIYEPLIFKNSQENIVINKQVYSEYKKL